MSHETQEEKLIRLGEMKTDFKARRLHESSELRLSRLEKARLVRQTNRLDGSTADSIKRFRDSIKVGPYFVCVICNRMLYRVSVTKCRTEKYPAGIRHIFTDVKSYDNTEYICHTCLVKAMKGKFHAKLSVIKWNCMLFLCSSNASENWNLFLFHRESCLRKLW